MGSLTILANARVLDCTGREPLEGAAVVVEDGRIREVAASGRVPCPAGATVLDCRGQTLMPGLTDAHVHVMAVEANILEQHRLLPPSLVALRAGVILRETLLQGYTTVRDCGGADWGVREAVAAVSLRRRPIISPVRRPHCRRPAFSFALRARLTSPMDALRSAWCWIGANSQQLTAVGTIAAAIVAGLYAWLTRKLWRATKTQAETTRQMFEAAYRPYVEAETDGDSFFNDERRYRIRWVLTHHGSVPAILIGWNARIRHGERGDISHQSDAGWRRTIYPKGDRRIEVMPGGLRGGEINQAAAPITVDFSLAYRGLPQTSYTTRMVLRGGFQDWEILDYEAT